MIQIEYDTPTEVTPDQLKTCRANLGGLFAWRFDGQKYWIKVWVNKYVSLFNRLLN